MILHNISKVWEKDRDKSQLRLSVKEYIPSISVKVIYLSTTGSQASVISVFQLDLPH